MSRLVLFLLFTVSIGYSQEYYFYAAAESDDTVSLISFDGETITEEERIPVGIMKTEIEGPHGLTVDPSGEYWYLSLAHGNPIRVSCKIFNCHKQTNRQNHFRHVSCLNANI